MAGSSLEKHEELPLQSLNTAFTNQDPSASMSQQYRISFQTYLFKDIQILLHYPLQFHSHFEKVISFSCLFCQTNDLSMRSFYAAPYKDRTERVVYESVNVKTMT